jgi:hypothetical protein
MSCPGINECWPVNFEKGKDMFRIRRVKIPIPSITNFKIPMYPGCIF